MTQRESVKLRAIDEKLDGHMKSQLEINGQMNETLKSLVRAIRGEEENNIPGLLTTHLSIQEQVVGLLDRVLAIEEINRQQDLVIKTTSEAKSITNNKWLKGGKLGLQILGGLVLLLLAARGVISWGDLLQIR